MVVGHGVYEEAEIVFAASYKGAWCGSGIFFDVLVYGPKIRIFGVSYHFFE